MIQDRLTPSQDSGQSFQSRKKKAVASEQEHGAPRQSRDHLITEALKEAAAPYLKMLAGLRAHQKGDLNLAEKIYRSENSRFSETFADTPDFKTLKALIAYDRKDFPKAEEAFLDLMRNNPSFSPAYLHMGRIYRKKRQYEKAQDMAQRALNLDPRNKGALYDIFWHHFKNRAPLESFRFLKKILKQQQEAQTYFALGQLLEKAAHKRFAQKSYEKALRLNPQDSLIQKTLGYIYLQNGSIVAAVDLFQSFFLDNPQDPEDLLSTLSLMEKNVPVEDIRNFIKEIFPYYETLALVFLKKMARYAEMEGNLQEALGYHEQIIQKEPSYENRIHAIGLFLTTGNIKKAFLHLKKAKEEKQDDPHLYSLWAKALQEDGRFDEATAFLQDAVKRFPRYRPLRQQRNKAEEQIGLG